MSEETGVDHRFVIFITEPKDHPSLELLRSIGEVRTGHRKQRYSEAELAEELRDCDAVLITSRDIVTRAVIEAAPRLKVISKYGARPENVDLEAAAEHGIQVLSAPLANPESVAEYAILLMLAALRRLIEVNAHLRAGSWRDTVRPTTELKGRTVGLVGLGGVGSRVAEKLGGFGVRLLAHDPYVPSDRAAALNVELVDLDTLLRQADVVSLHAMVTPNTRHMIGEAQLRTMRPSAILVNTARGALVDEPVLVRALQERWIAGAGLDVFEDEPVAPDNPLLSIETVVVTPHVAANTQEAIDRELNWAAEDLKRVLLGGSPEHC